MTALLFLLLAAPGGPAPPVGSIHVRVEGGEADVVAVRAGVVVARVPTRGGAAVLSGLRRGAYDVYAENATATAASAVRRNVRAVPGGAGAGEDERGAFDVVLQLRPVFPVAVKTSAGASAWSGGRRYDAARLRLPAGLHRVVVDHASRVSSPARLVRVAGRKGGAPGAEVELPLEPGLVVLGRVVDADGDPVAGARVAALADGFATNRHTLTRADGTFGLQGFHGAVISVEISARGFATALRRAGFEPGSERARVGITLVAGSSVALEADTIVEAVLLPAWVERALEEPRLRANHATERRTGKRVFFAGLTPGRRYRILLSAPGRQPTATAAFVAPPAGTTRELPGAVLRSAGEISGAVLARRTRRPFGAGTVVVCRGPEGTQACRVDRHGTFLFTGLDAGAHALSIRDVDEKPRAVTLAAGERKRVDLVPGNADDAGEEEREIAGIVMDAVGIALAGVVVETAGREARTNEKGEFRIGNLPRGREQFTLRFTPGAECRALVKDPHLPHTQERVRAGANLRVPLKRAGTLRLSFDALLARATLLISSNDRTVRRRLPRRARGIEVFDLPVGSYTVDVAAPGLLGSGGVVLPVRRGAGEPVLLRLARGRRAAGRVVLRRTVPREGKTPLVSDKPVPRGWVSMLDAGALRVMAVAPIEEDGSFTLDGLPLERIVLCAAAPGLPTCAFEVDLAAADRNDLVFAMREPVSAVVSIVGEKGEPVPGAAVRILDMLRPDFGVDVRDVAALGRFRRVVADDADLFALARAFRVIRGSGGRVEAPFLRPGSYKFLVSAKGYKPVRVGVRARTAWQEEQIQKSLKDVAVLPDVLETKIRLARSETKD